MLTTNNNRECIFAAIDFDIVPMGRTLQAADAVVAHGKPKMVGGGPVQYILRLPDPQCLLIVASNRVSWQLFGFAAWKGQLERTIELTNSAIRELAVTQFNRIGLKIMAFIPQEMRHAEISRLMFGSFLMDHEALERSFGELDDPLIQFHGKRGNFNYVLQLTAMTKENATNAFRNLPNLEGLLDDKYLDDSLRQFHDRIAAHDCLYCDIDISQANLPAGNLRDFFVSSADTAEWLADAAVRHLQSKPMKK